MKKLVKDLKIGDVLSGSGAIIQSTPISLTHTPAGKLEVIVKYSESAEAKTCVWNARTEITVNDPEPTAEEVLGSDAGVMHFTKPEVVHVEDDGFSIEEPHTVAIEPVDHTLAELQELAQKWEGFVVTADNVKEATAGRKEIRDKRYKLQNWKKSAFDKINDLKNQVSARIERYIGVVDSAEENLDNGIKAVEKVKAEALAKKKREEQEAIIAAEREAMRLEREKFEAEKAELERQRQAEEQVHNARKERQDKRLKQLFALGMQYNYDYGGFLRPHDGINFHYTDIEGYDDAKWDEAIAKVTPLIEAYDAKQRELEAERLAAAAAADAETEKIKAEAAYMKAELDRTRQEYEAERRKVEEEAARVKAEQEAKERAEREAKAKAEREAKEAEERRIAAEKAEQDRLAAEARAAALRPDVVKMADWLVELRLRRPADPELSTDTARFYQAEIVKNFERYIEAQQELVNQLK